MESLVTALALGFAAGITPGPLLTLVISSTLERGFGAGLRVSLAPALTDGPVLALCLLLLKDLSNTWLSGISLAGGVYLLFLGVKTLRKAPAGVEVGKGSGSATRDFRDGMLVNVLNPNPWIFWIGVGSPVLIAAWRDHPMWAVGFLTIFYGLLVGSKIVLAWVTARSRRFLTGSGYTRALQLSGLMLLGLGVWLIWRGFTGVSAPA